MSHSRRVCRLMLVAVSTAIAVVGFAPIASASTASSSAASAGTMSVHGPGWCC